MAKSKTAVTKNSDKLTKVSESFQIHMYDNAFMIEVSGRDSENDYKTVKLMVPTLDQLWTLISETTEMEKDN
jgi:hypothetical protein